MPAHGIHHRASKHPSTRWKRRRNIIDMKRHIILSGGALVSGLAIGWIDTRPGWDDTGVTIALILLTSGVLGFAVPKHAWVRALIIGGCVALLNILRSGRYDALVAVAVALIGGFLGSLPRLQSTARKKRSPTESR
jgi:hypothetical protein